MPRNKQPPRCGQRPQPTRAQLVAQLGGQPTTASRAPVPASTSSHIPLRDRHNTAHTLPSSQIDPTPDLSKIVIPSALIPKGKTRFTPEEIRDFLKDGTAFRLTSTTEEGRMEEFKQRLEERTGVEITDDMVGCAKVPEDVRKAAEEAWMKQRCVDGTTMGERMGMLKKVFEEVQLEREERERANEEWTKEPHPSDIPTEPNSPVSLSPKTSIDTRKPTMPQAEKNWAALQVIKEYDSIGYTALLCNLTPSELSKEVFEHSTIVPPDSKGPITAEDERLVLEEVIRIITARFAGEEEDEPDDKNIRVLTPSEVTAHAHEIIQLFTEKKVIAKLWTFTPEELEAFVAATFVHGNDEEDGGLYADEIAIMEEVIELLNGVFTTLDEEEAQAEGKGKDKGREPYSRDDNSSSKATTNPQSQCTMSKAEITNLALHVIQGYDRAGYIAKLRNLNAEQIYRQVIQQGKRAPEDEDERVVLEEVVRVLIKRFGAKWEDGSEQDKGKGTEKGKGKGKDTPIPAGPLGNTGVVVAEGQTASQAVYAQWQKVKEQTKKWEAEGVRMKAYDIYVENGEVKKKLKESSGMPGGRGGLR